MKDTTHLTALHTRLAHEKERLSSAKAKREKELRAVWIAQIEKEIADEFKFLGMSAATPELSDDDLIAALSA